MLGFRGHFSTKSRSYSITLGALCRARHRFQKLATVADDEETTLVIGSWTYQGTGWPRTGDEALALAAARAREHDQWKAERKNTNKKTA